ncbi:PREDICTED: E4 SUMO-protein ligase PIAL2-like isoform X2 [Ipomoea nil]|uniref:E4 SUMO-protein ligase PIAL2-like isoform X2 n=1 Tax=Ipomoea nil TaxID=35883 RepID=UPI0009017C22|nr:PREDICTED: E4 SUMO-protein ligase PIAL2-like isoform X2 [Ipomoea nil]
MAGQTVSNPGAAARANAGAGAGANASNALYLNSFRISAAADRLAMHVGPQPKNDLVEFCQLCLSLARGIDCAIATHDVPTKALELPSLLKQVCKRKNDSLIQAAVMVLMISVKSACQSGWFSDKDSEDLCHLTNEISSSFCSEPDFKCEPSTYLSTLSMIMSRFFPLLKMGQIFAFLEVKPGYGTFINDFHILKSVKTTAQDKIRVLVAQVDNTETSSCLINPPQANFLLNGKGVEKRTNVFMDTGPQIPTIVSHMLKYGTNLLQAVGEFNGTYIVAVAFMSIMPTPDPATLLNYVQPTPASVDPDSEIIEGPSRISLNCPISFKRIKTPVKGQSCKHLQCFDYQNYIDINSRRPSWRCPHCNQQACFTDIRIDQDMVKVLKEVGENVTDVILSSDGSWKAVMESDDPTGNPPVNKPDISKDETMLPDCNGISSSSADILDLTEMDDAMDVVGTGEIEDIKSVQTNCQNQPSTSNPSCQNQPSTSNPSEVNQASHMDDAFWSGFYFSRLESGTSRPSSNMQIDGVSEPVPTSLMLPPVLTDPLIQASVMQGGDSSPNNLQYQFLNSAIANDYGRMPSIVRHAVNRAPIAVQALPAQMPSPVHQQRPRGTIGDVILNVPSATPQATSVSTNAGSSNVEKPQQQLSRSNSNMVQASQVSPSTLPNKQLEHSSAPIRPTQQFVGHKNPIHTPTPYRASSGFTAESLKRSWQGMANQQKSYTANQSPGLSRSLAPGFSRNNAQGSLQSGVGQARGVASGQQLQPTLVAQRTAQIARPVQLSRAAPPLSANADSPRPSLIGDQRGSATPGTVPVDLPTDPDWRPTGRMRGSLSGRAYNEALEQYIIRPTQQAQAPRPSIPPNISPQLQALMANRSVHASPLVNPPSSTPAAAPDASSAGLPQHSSGIA